MTPSFLEKPESDSLLDRVKFEHSRNMLKNGKDKELHSMTQELDRRKETALQITSAPFDLIREELMAQKAL